MTIYPKPPTNHCTMLDYREPWLGDIAILMRPDVFSNDYDLFSGLNGILDNHLRKLGVNNKCKAASVPIRINNLGYEVHTKVITHEGNFVHVDKAEEYPSPELDAKILMVCG